MDDDFREFLAWEKTSRDTVDFRTIYVDIAGDLVAGLMLSQLVYWCLLPDEMGKSKLRVRLDGHWWVAKNRDQWWDEIRVTPKRVDRAIKVLVNAGLVVKRNSLFNGKRTPHLRIDWEAFRDAWRANLPEPKSDTQPGAGNAATDQRSTPVSPKGSHRYSPEGYTGVDQKVAPITEITAETTAEMTTSAAAASVTCSIHNVQMRLRVKNSDRWYSHQHNGIWCRGAPGDQPGDGNGRNDRRHNGTTTVTCPSCYLVRAVECTCPDCGQCLDCCTCA